MKINIRFHLFLCLISGVIGAGEAYLFSQSAPYMDTLTILDVFAPVIVMGGLVNGYYLFFNWIRVREFTGKSIMGACIAFLGFPVIVFLGVLSLVPLLLVDFFLMLIRKWDTYKISTIGGGGIIKADDEALAFDEIEDLTCKEKIRGYSQYVNRLRIVLLLLFLGVNILVGWYLKMTCCRLDWRWYPLSCIAFCLR